MTTGSYLLDRLIESGKYEVKQERVVLGGRIIGASLMFWPKDWMMHTFKPRSYGWIVGRNKVGDPKNLISHSTVNILNALVWFEEARMGSHSLGKSVRFYKYPTTDEERAKEETEMLSWFTEGELKAELLRRWLVNS